MIQFNTEESAQDRINTVPLTLAEEKLAVAILNRCLFAVPHQAPDREDTRLIQRLINHYQNLGHFATIHYACGRGGSQAMENTSVLANGAKVAHGDAVICNTTIRFSLKDRLRILFGRKVRTTSTIYCQNQTVQVITSESKTTVDRLFPDRPKQGFGMMAPTEQAHDTHHQD